MKKLLATLALGLAVLGCAGNAFAQAADAASAAAPVLLVAPDDFTRI